MWPSDQKNVTWKTEQKKTKKTKQKKTGSWVQRKTSLIFPFDISQLFSFPLLCTPSFWHSEQRATQTLQTNASSIQHVNFSAKKKKTWQKWKQLRIWESVLLDKIINKCVCSAGSYLCFLHPHCTLVRSTE